MINRYGQVNWQSHAATGALLKANDRSPGLCSHSNYHFNRSQRLSKSFRVINSSLLVLSCCAVAFTVNAEVAGASSAQNSIKQANKATAHSGREVAPSSPTASSITGAVSTAAAAAASAPMADVIAIREGADLDLSCPIVLQNEDMIISWTCENELANIRSSRIHVTETGKLRIRSARPGDSCNYRCEAADGFATLSVIIKVIIVDKQMVDQIGHHNQTVASAFSVQKQPAAVNQSNQQQQHSAPPTKLHKSGPQQKFAPPTDPSGLHYGTNVVSSSSDQLHQPDELSKIDGHRQQLQQAELEVQVEPASIGVDKNQTFSLECRVKHPPGLIAPQIIWLKEFIGRKPESLREAHEQNLVLIDNVYYHSLNWPRSDSQSTASVNSALLMRQSNFVHSGNYICFAGYPPATMLSNLSFAPASSDYDQRRTTITAPLGDGKSATFVRSAPPKSPLKYKMAIASVQVNDKEGEARHKQMLEAADSEGQYLPEQNLLIRAVLTNSWKRNLTALLLVLCSIVCISKFVYTHCYLGDSSDESQESRASSNLEAANQQIVESTRPRSYTRANNNLGQAYTPPRIAVKQIQSFPKYNIQQPSYILLTPNANSPEPIGDCSASYRRLRQPDSEESCLQRLADEQAAELTRLHQRETDHLYSEIGERFNIINPSQMISTNNAGSDHEIYKAPNNHSGRNAAS